MHLTEKVLFLSLTPLSSLGRGDQGLFWVQNVVEMASCLTLHAASGVCEAWRSVWICEDVLGLNFSQ